MRASSERKNRDFRKNPRHFRRKTFSGFLQFSKIIFSTPGRTMSTNLFVRISAPYASIAPFLASIALGCRDFAVVEHEADEEISRTHCHILMGGYPYTREKLRKAIIDGVKVEGVTGNSLKSIKEWTDTDDMKPLIYMLKGELSFKIWYGFAQFQISDVNFDDYVRSMWETYQDPNDGAKKLYKKCFDSFHMMSVWTPGEKSQWQEIKSTAEIEAEELRRVRAKVSKHVKRFAFQECGQFWSFKFENMCKMLENTYMMRLSL